VGKFASRRPVPAVLTGNALPHAIFKLKSQDVLPVFRIPTSADTDSFANRNVCIANLRWTVAGEMSMNPKIKVCSRLAVFCVLLVCTSALHAQKRITIQANAKGTSTQMGQMVPVKVIIESFSTPEERQLLIDGFKKDRTDGMRDVLEKMNPRGRVAAEGRVGNDVKFIRELPAENGERRFRLVTDRNVAMAESRNGTRSRDYSVGAIELTIAADGKSGSGTMLPACKLKMDKKTNEVEIEAYQNPWKLENFIVTIED
jgi:hypothetical protein